VRIGPHHQPSQAQVVAEGSGEEALTGNKVGKDRAAVEVSPVDGLRVARRDRCECPVDIERPRDAVGRAAIDPDEADDLEARSTVVGHLPCHVTRQSRIAPARIGEE
jgi:hypothetical protein